MAVGNHGQGHLFLVLRAHNFFGHNPRHRVLQQRVGQHLPQFGILPASFFSCLASLISIVPICIFQRWKVPPNNFSLKHGDVIQITISPIGTLNNLVA